MAGSLFPLIYAGCLLFLLLQAFRMMRPGKALLSRAMERKDRTGLVTTHPELLDDQGELTKDDLLVVRFPDQGSLENSPNA
ncbi:DUF2973 domain-containing protein [Synechococcus sp. CS-197]|jgi:hypothetical protein|uniref:DUF2973 domain-containing protein n=1 Tax=Synechococcus sp. CS-197 TaxID=2847985 RepID=UPI0001525689|nr:DUF2973 domain-containing protein [Synechococcus sp. CS-197]MCT0251855.1 DUF2973 domain-containing protein [Synechococcus sp. CS-197]PTT92382.1 DUF2973 domain-containing protein [Pseudomonas sp. HMWF031]CAK23426.1 Uncharacterized conserved membrane protein [Synechococcus sp. WH 7803]